MTTSAYTDRKEYEEWLDYLDKGGTTEEWNELKNSGKAVAKSNDSGIMKSGKMSDVFSGGKRNEVPLTEEQQREAFEAIERQGYTGEIHYSENSNTSFHGSTEGDAFCYMVVGTDVFPNGSKSTKSANEAISLNGCAAHEVIGHYEAWKKGTTQSVEVLEEAQASIRASKFGIDLTDEERDILMQDALDRLNRASISFDDVQDILDIWER